ncbi:unnamed protein product, partial [marine sediment metagenome]
MNLSKRETFKKNPYFLFILAFFLSAFVGICLYRPKKVFKSIVLLAIGDTGTGEKMQYKVADAMTKVCKENSCSGVLLLGDIMQDMDGIFSVNDPDLKLKFEEPYKKLNVPFYMALGNHDYLGCVSCNIAYSTMSAKWNLPS